MSFGKVLLLGNLTRDPEVRFTPSNTAVCNFSVAVNRRWKDGNGEAQEETTFVDCAAWGKRGEAIGQFFKKGQQIFVEGDIRQDRWEDKETGQPRSKLVANITNFSFTGTKQGGDSTDDDDIDI